MVFILFALLMSRWAPAADSRERIPFGESSSLLFIMLPIQVAIYILFSQLTVLVFRAGALSWPPTPAAVGWVVSGLGAVVLWCMAAVPARYWGRLASRCSPLIAPCAILAGLSLISGVLATRAWEPLRSWTFALAAGLLRWLGQDVFSQPKEMVLGVNGFNAGIYWPCSGYEGIGLMVLFVGAYLWFFRSRLRFPLALLLFPIGALTIWLVNVARIAALLMLGAYVSPKLASEGFHSQVGWLAFIAVSLGTVGLAEKSRVLSKVAGSRTRRAGRVTAYLVPLMVLLGSGLFMGLFTNGFDRFYVLRSIAAAAALLYYWRPAPLRELFSGLSWRPFAAGVLAYIVWTALQPAGGHQTSTVSHGLALMTPGLAAAWIFFRAAGSVLVVPAVEELAFRGYLLRRLSTQGTAGLRFSLAAFVLSSVLFGAMHGRWVVGAFAGACYAWTMYKRDRVVDAWIAHALTNALIACEVLLLGHYSLWS